MFVPCTVYILLITGKSTVLYFTLKIKICTLIYIMIYTIKEKGNLVVKASSPLFALRKFVNKLVGNVRKRGGDIFEIKREFLTFTCPEGKDHVYMFTIFPSDVQRSIYYERDYQIQIFKLMRNL